MIDGLGVAVFDNLTMKVDCSSYSTQGETGYKLDMTNWLSTRVPQSLACCQKQSGTRWLQKW